MSFFGLIFAFLIIEWLDLLYIPTMLIDKDLLVKYGAVLQKYKSNEIVFRENDLPLYYFQVEDGVVEVINYNEDGRVFIQEVVSKGESIGEALLFTDKRYPITAVAKTKCTIIKLSKDKFLNLIENHPHVSLKLLLYLADKTYYKDTMLHNLYNKTPASRIKFMMDYLKSYCKDKRLYSFIIPLTRQQLANLIGLRVETVIKTIKNMEKDKILKIKNGKILY